MKKILFIVPYPQEVAPSQRFRFEHYYNALHQKGHEFKISSFWTKKAWVILYQKGHFFSKAIFLLSGYFKRILLLFHVHGFDLVFLHREATPLGPPFVEFIIARLFKKKIIYDFDDAIWLPNTSEQNRIIGKLKYHQKVENICRWSWKISCGNGFLMNFASKFNNKAMYNPTVINTSYHQSSEKKSTHSTVTIGWTGTHSTSKYLINLLPILSDLKNKYSINILIISNQNPNWEALNYEFVPWNKENEIEQLDRIDIGIMPLEDNEWEKGKCGFKALQYMAMGKPAVVSSVGVNKTIINHEKNGYMCENIQDWSKYLEKLILSEKLRSSIGKQGRAKVINVYSVNSNEDRFFSLFE